MIRLSFKPLSLVLLTLACMAAASTASAGTITTWLGSGTSSNWSTANNWTTTPTTSGTFSLVYEGNRIRMTGTNNLGPDAVKVDSILFASTVASSTSNFTLAKSATTPALSLLNGATVTTIAATSGTLSDSISSAIEFGGTATFNMGSRHNLLLSGTLSGGGSLVKQGAGDLTFSGTNNLVALSIEQGVVQFNQKIAFDGITGLTVDIGSSGTTGTFRTSNVNSGTTPYQTNIKFNLNGDANITPNNSSNITFNAANFNEAVASISTPVTLSLVGGAGEASKGTQTINGVIQDNSVSGKVNVTIGTPTSWNVWVFNGGNTYTGDTTVEAGGKLLMNGTISGSSTTTSYGYLGGSGTFGGAVIVSSGTLAPGGSSAGGVIVDTVGDLTMASLSLSSTATTQLTITGTAANLYDQIVAVGSGELTYGGNLALTLTGSQAYALNTTFNLFENFVTRSGSFSSVTLLATDTPYDGLVFANVGGGIWETGPTGDPLNEYLRFEQSTGNLVAVPEPSTYAMALAGLAYGGWQIFRRRRLRQAPALAA
jgi:fibronectin-binding autotransporter adhesin